MRDGLEFVEAAAAAGGRVTEDDGRQGTTVDRAVAGDDVGAEVGDDRIVGGTAGLEHLAADRVDIDDDHARSRRGCRRPWTCPAPIPPVRPMTSGCDACGVHQAGVKPMWSSFSARRQKFGWWRKSFAPSMNHMSSMRSTRASKPRYSSRRANGAPMQ